MISGQPQAKPAIRRLGLPILLYVATFLSTWLVGGPAFSLALMTTLTAHELGHFFQARRYRVPASLPYFIPMPLTPIGTMGAVILMKPGLGDRRALYDIAITGPLAGLIPAVSFSILGLHWSEVVEMTGQTSGLKLGEPILFQGMARIAFGTLPEGYDIILHPVGFAGWVGIFITALNLIPIGQLDGGHILYALLLKRAHFAAKGLLVVAIVAVVVLGYWGWTLMIILLLVMGPMHPPTANDEVPLGRGRTILGWACLPFVLVGFTPVPFYL